MARVGQRGAAPGWAVPGRVLHLVTDALPATSAGYTVRTQRIAAAQRAAGLDPHVVTKAGFPVAQGHLDGRRVTEVDGVPYHRLLPYRLPPRADHGRRARPGPGRPADRDTPPGRAARRQ